MNSIKKKILLLLALSMGGSMLLAGISLSVITKNNYENSTRVNFEHYYDRARSTFKKISSDTSFYSSELSERETINNSLSLIYEYSDINDYQANIYDEEKKNIARTLYEYAKSSHLYEIKIYDKDGWLTAFSNPSHTLMGIISFYKGKPIIMVSTAGNKEWKITKDLDNVPLLKINKRNNLTSTTYVQHRRHVGVQSISKILRTYSDGAKKEIGAVYVIKDINESILRMLSKGSNSNHGLFTPNKKWIGDEIKEATLDRLFDSPPLFNSEQDKESQWIDNENHLMSSFSVSLSNGLHFYLVSSLDRNIINKQINETLFIIFIVFAALLFILLPIGVLFSRYSITSPLDRLVKQANSLEKGKYEAFDTKESMSDEISALADAFNAAVHTVRDRENELQRSHELLEIRVEDRTSDLVALNNDLEKENKVRLEAENKLAESTKMLQLVMDNIPQFVFWKDINSSYLGCNTNFSTIAGMNSPQDVIGKNDFDMPWSKGEADFYVEVDQRVISSDKAEYNIQETLQKTNGDIIHVETNKVPLHDINGKVMGILGTFQDITERKRFEEEIIEARNLAEKANQAKSEFLSRMSHELRTPLNAILGFAQLLDLNPENKNNPTTTSNINEILDAGTHLLKLITEVLDLAKIESGGLVLDCEMKNISNIIFDSVKLTQKLANTLNINLENDTKNCEQQLVFVDETKLKQVFINLISNAIKYNKNGGKVIINCSYDNHWIKFHVIDTGMGISPSNINKLFTSFERLGNENSGIDGTGIGLMICKELIEHMGGEIGVESTEGEGSTFWFTLPCYTGDKE